MSTILIPDRTRLEVALSGGGRAARSRPARSYFSLGILDLNTLVKLLIGRRHVVGRVEKTEVVGTEPDLRHFRRHDWEVFHAWVVGKSIGVPDDNVLIANLFAAVAQPGFDTGAS